MKTLRQRLVLASCLTALASPALAIDVTLVAGSFEQVMPDGTTVQMWGYALDPDGAGAQPPGTVSSPGPVITVPHDDSTLRIHLRNKLPVPTSLIIPGQPAAPAPTWIDAAGTVLTTGNRPSGNVTARMRSLMTETAPGDTRTYEWTGLKAGTYLYRSSTQPQVQVQMGLHGGLRKDHGQGLAYDGKPYDNDILLLFSEVDPALHEAVTNGTYGSASYPSTIGYVPEYFLVNGEPYPGSTPIIGHPVAMNERVLVRLINAGLQSHAALAQGLRLTVVAEDGQAYAYPRDLAAVPLAAGKTSDATFIADTAGVYALYDRMLSLTNGLQPAGGLMVQLRIPGGAPIANGDAFTASAGETLTIAAPGLLGNDSDAENDPLTASLVDNAAHGTATVQANGAFSYTPTAGYTGPDSFTYRVNDGTTDSPVATVSLTVVPGNTAPVGVADTYANVQEDTLYSVAAPGVLGNDTDADGNALSASLVGSPSSGDLTLSPDGRFTYKPKPNFTGAATFSYKASDGKATSAPVTVTLQVQPVNDPPAAVADTYNFNGSLSLAAPGVLGNDSDPDGNTLSAVLKTPPSRAAAFTLNANGSISYTPGSTFQGTDSFTYAASDGTAESSPVTVTLIGNQTPVAQADTASARRNRSVLIPVTANDSDPDGTIVPASVIISTAPSSGTAVTDGKGNVTYTAGGSRTTATFKYTVKDNLGAVSSPATVNVTVR